VLLLLMQMLMLILVMMLVLVAVIATALTMPTTCAMRWGVYHLRQRPAPTQHLLHPTSCRPVLPRRLPPAQQGAHEGSGHLRTAAALRGGKGQRRVGWRMLLLLLLLLLPPPPPPKLSKKNEIHKKRMRDLYV
jgi:hypothetical protein